MKPDTLNSNQIDKMRNNRNRSMRLALVTTVFARLSGILLQVISLPIAATQLGAAGFSVYAMLGSLLAAMTLSNLGMSQATTLRMSEVLATGKARIGREVFVASLCVVGSIAFGLTVICIGIILFSPLINNIFSQHIQNLPAPILPCLFVCFVFLCTQILTVFEAGQLALQRQHKLNVALCIGTFIAAVSVWFVAKNNPDVFKILTAVHLPVILARSINAIGVWSEISPRYKDFERKWRHIRGIFTDGLRFVSGTTIANFLCHSLSVFMIGLFASSVISASFAALMNAIILFSASFGMVSKPFKPALTESSRIPDFDWMRRAVRFMFTVNLSFGMLGFILLGPLGAKLFEVWYQGVIQPSNLNLWGAGFYLFVLSQEVSLFVVSSSIGYLKIASRWVFCKSIIAALCMLFLTYVGTYDLHFWVLSITSILFTLLPLGFLLFRETPLLKKSSG